MDWLFDEIYSEITNGEIMPWDGTHDALFRWAVGTGTIDDMSLSMTKIANPRRPNHIGNHYHQNLIHGNAVMTNEVEQMVKHGLLTDGTPCDMDDLFEIRIVSFDTIIAIFHKEEHSNAYSN